MDISEIARVLSRSRVAPSKLRAPRDPGICAVYLRSADALPRISVGDECLLFVGCSSDLARREFDTHFGNGQTGFSTLRRSIGALIKDQLRLSAEPRGKSNSPSNYANFKFDNEGERRLTLWMAENLDVSVYEVQADYKELKRRLIEAECPALNLSGWKNPNRALVEQMRKICADEARGSAHD